MLSAILSGAVAKSQSCDVRDRLTFKYTARDALVLPFDLEFFGCKRSIAAVSDLMSNATLSDAPMLCCLIDTAVVQVDADILMDILTPGT